MFERIDPAMRPVERGLNLPDGITSRQMVPEIAARLLEIPVDLIASDVTGAKIAKAIGGILLTIVPAQVGPLLSRDWIGRDTEDIYAIGKQWLLEATDPTPEDLIKIANAIANLRAAFAYGDMSRIARVLGAKSLDAIAADFANVGKSFASAFGIPTAKAPPKPEAPTAPLYKETLSGPGEAKAAPSSAPKATAIPGVSQMFRFTSDHAQPGAPTVAPRFRITIG